MTISFLEKPFESLEPCTSISTAFKQKGIYQVGSMASSGKRSRLNADATKDLVTRLQDTQRLIPELVAVNINEFIGANDMGTSEELTERTQHAQHSKRNGENLAWQVFVTDHLKPEASKGFYSAQVNIRDIPSCLRQSFKEVARRHGLSVERITMSSTLRLSMMSSSFGGSLEL